MDPLIARYDAEAAAYQQWWEPVLRTMGCRLLDRLPLRDTRSVLDLGAGAGGLLQEIRRRAPRAKLVGLDPSAGMLTLAARRGPDSLVQAEAERLPFAAGSFEAIVMAFMLFHLTDPTTGLKDAVRVMAPGGLLGIAVWGSQPDYPALEHWNEALDRLGAPPDPITWVRHHDSMNSPDRLADLTRAAGVSRCEAWVESFEVCWDPEEFLQFRTNVGPSRRRFEHLGAVQQRELTHWFRARFSEADPEAFTYHPEVVCLIGRAD